MTHPVLSSLQLLGELRLSKVIHQDSSTTEQQHLDFPGIDQRHHLEGGVLAPLQQLQEEHRMCQRLVQVSFPQFSWTTVGPPSITQATAELSQCTNQASALMDSVYRWEDRMCTTAWERDLKRVVVILKQRFERIDISGLKKAPLDNNLHRWALGVLEELSQSKTCR
ncbi:hypothetical protein LTR56_023780 [Elasticomyces elasticus]|nr:hypothetical protein LTR56_023780 [Elasticomyces elasticus]KAK3638051.1 hypothetical protein LTR22_018013 [Elasticomyces elasticus]KAK4912911.1 hypothetical protein LTR49_018661 [Elasticomyces elasticus]